MNVQLPLGISLPVFKRFDSYVAEGNELLIDMLRSLSVKQDEQQLLMWGQNGSGKSHLLQAVCDLANQFDRRVAYIPLEHFIEGEASILDGLQNVDIICIDNCELAYQVERWELALFNLINACRETKACLLFASSANPVKAAIDLPDLQSRLQWGPVIHLQPLDDEKKHLFLQQRAFAVGLQMDDKTANYILQHYRRDMESLSSLVAHLDKASLAAGRRLSIPFVKEVIQEIEA